MRIVLGFILIFLCSWSYGQDDPIELDTLIIGEFDGKKGLDTAYLYIPKKEININNCRSCISEIRFSNQKYVIRFMSDIGGPFENVGDLDDDGIDEIAHTRTWYEGCWGSYEIYQNNGYKWVGVAVQEYRVCRDKKGIKARITVLGDGVLRLEGNDIDGTVVYEDVQVF
jgi:hypothetical protein